MWSKVVLKLTPPDITLNVNLFEVIFALSLAYNVTILFVLFKYFEGIVILLLPCASVGCKSISALLTVIIKVPSPKLGVWKYTSIVTLLPSSIIVVSGNVDSIVGVNDFSKSPRRYFTIISFNTSVSTPSIPPLVPPLPKLPSV